MRFVAALTALILAAPSAAAAADAPPTAGAPLPSHVGQALEAAMAKSPSHTEQARGLVKLAWPDGSRDNEIAAGARHELELFGADAATALTEAINDVKPAYGGEVVQTMMGAISHGRAGTYDDFIPALIDALYVDNHEARSLAIKGFLGARPPLAVQPMIDAAIDDPTLQPQVVEALGTLRYDQARFYLEKILNQGPVSLKASAASSLAQIGGAALGPLKNALKSPDKETRTLAARALVPSATDRELGAIYDYIRDHGEDNPALTQALKSVTVQIEKAIAARDANAAAAAPKDF